MPSGGRSTGSSVGWCRSVVPHRSDTCDPMCPTDPAVGGTQFNEGSDTFLMPEGADGRSNHDGRRPTGAQTGLLGIGEMRIPEQSHSHHRRLAGASHERPALFHETPHERRTAMNDDESSPDETYPGLPVSSATSEQSVAGSSVSGGAAPPTPPPRLHQTGQPRRPRPSRHVGQRCVDCCRTEEGLGSLLLRSFAR